MSDKKRRDRRTTDRLEDTLGSFGVALASVRIARKTGQLCKEVSRTLACVLGASADAWLRSLALVAVEPAPDAARLLVIVCPPSAQPGDVPQLLARLQAQRGLLRSEVAAALQRKRTPELAFHVALAGPHALAGCGQAG